MTLLNKVIIGGTALAATAALYKGYTVKLEKFADNIQQVENIEQGEQVAEELKDDCNGLLFDFFKSIGYNK